MHRSPENPQVQTSFNTCTNQKHVKLTNPVSEEIKKAIQEGNSWEVKGKNKERKKLSSSFLTPSIARGFGRVAEKKIDQRDP